MTLTATSFDELHQALQAAPNLVDEMMLEGFAEVLRREQPERLSGRRRFHGSRPKEQPAVIRTAQLVSGRRRQPLVREHVGQIGANRRGLGRKRQGRAADA